MKQGSMNLALVLAAIWAAPGMADEAKLPVRVLYVGNLKNSEAAAYEKFLHRNFSQVVMADRTSFDPAKAKYADVVLLSWSQSERTEREVVSPLGSFEDWSKPTVLLGSAGHLMAGKWQIIGGAG